MALLSQPPGARSRSVGIPRAALQIWADLLFQNRPREVLRLEPSRPHPRGSRQSAAKIPQASLVGSSKTDPWQRTVDERRRLPSSATTPAATGVSPPSGPALLPNT